MSAGHDIVERAETANAEALFRSDERQRIARELHESTSQLLTVLQLELGRLKRLNHPDALSLIEECQGVIEEIGRQIRGLRLDRS